MLSFKRIVNIISQCLDFLLIMCMTFLWGQEFLVLTWSNSGVLIYVHFVSCLIIPSQRHSPKFSSHFKALGFCPGLYFCWTSQVALVVKNLPSNAGDIKGVGLIPGSGRSSGEGNGNPLQYSCLENSRDRGVWWATVHGVSQSWTRLSDEAQPKCREQRQKKT